MKHPSEEQLLLYHYGEAGGGEVEAHLAACDPCRTAYDSLRRVLAVADAAPVPERGEDYGAEVWRRIEPRLGEDSQPGWAARARSRFGAAGALLFRPRSWALAGAMAALVIAAFLAGRISTRTPRPGQPASEMVRERILLVTVGEHLERSQMVLVELANTAPRERVNIAAEQRWAEDLVDANRLYRQTAARSGDVAIASVLDELERVLLEIARSPSELSRDELEKIQRRIESQGILFKVRVIASRVREQAAQPAGEQGTGTSPKEKL